MRNVALVLTMILSQTLFAEASILGRWKTIDDVTKQPKGIIEITEKDGVYTGILVDTFSKAEAVCTECTGDQKGKPFLGLKLIWYVKKTAENEWRDGRIMDPKNGMVYRVKLSLEDNDQKLKVRGYLAIDTPFSGRTQHWHREPAVKPGTPSS